MDIKKIIERNGEYWKQRFKILEQIEHSKTTEYIADLEKIYGVAISNCEAEISKWYQRIADNNNITYIEAKKLLSKNELQEFKWAVEEYIRHGQENAVSRQWIKELENASAKVHISRLEAMKMQMQQQVEIVIAKETEGMEELLKDIFEDSYYRSVFEFQRGIGIGSTFTKLDDKTVSKIIHKPWTADGSEFSERIWGKHRTQLINNLHTELSHAFIRGDNPQTLAGSIKKKFEVTRSQAENLALTESAFFRAFGQKKAYEEMNVEEFEISATLDSRTSEICRYMDGKVFKTKDLQVGVNHPPFHCRCRSTSVPYFSDEFTEGEKRAVRNKNGKYYTVPANMKFEEWSKKYLNDSITEQGKLAYKKYQNILEGVMPSIDEFIEIRYNDNSWKQFKAYASSVKSGELSPLADFKLYQDISDEIDKILIGNVIKNGIEIRGKSNHFIARIIGSTEQRRSGVNIKDVLETLLKPTKVDDVRVLKNGRSQRFIGNTIAVTINPDTGILIQTNPRIRRKKGKK